MTLLNFVYFYTERRVWTESFLKRAQVTYLTADRYRVDQHILTLKEIRMNAKLREERDKAREDREQLLSDMRSKEHEFACEKEKREIRRQEMAEEEHNLKLQVLKAKRDLYLLQAKQIQKDMGQ